MNYIEQTFQETGITPQQLNKDPSLIERLVEAGMRITRGQANPHLLEAELIDYAEKLNADHR